MACRWNYSQNRCSISLNEWANEDNCDSHVLLYSSKHGNNIENKSSVLRHKARSSESSSKTGNVCELRLINSIILTFQLFTKSCRLYLCTWTVFWTMKNDPSRQLLIPFEHGHSFAARLLHVWLVFNCEYVHGGNQFSFGKILCAF